MKQNRTSVAGRVCLGQICGTNIDTEDVKFTKQKPNLTYVDKVFSYNRDTASPILFNLNTGGANQVNFITQIQLDGSSFFPCVLTPNAVFEIENSFVAVEYFNTRPPGNITAPQVTLDGFPVDSVSFSNGQYTARTENVLASVLRDRCLDRGLATKVYFLITGAGPWDIRATYVLEGTVNTNGRTCRFRIEIANAPGSPNSMLPAGALSSFAVPGLSLPCSINGISPEILFQVSARVNLVNPQLTVTCTQPDTCTVFLDTNVAVEPVVHVQTVRRTLFCINACEGLQPCDGSVLAAEIEDRIEDCEIGGVDRPDCRCADGHDGRCRGRTTASGDSSGSGGNFPGGAIDNSQNLLAGVYGVGNVGLDGVTVGTGTCEDCVWGETEGHDCRPRRRRRDDAAGIGDRVRSHFRNDVLGEADRRFIKGLLKELREELADDTEDVAGVGFAPDGTLGIDEEEAAEITGRIEDIPRTAFRRHGCNGCSW